MKVIDEIKSRYLPLVSHFLPHRVEITGEIGYQIELFKLSAEDQGLICENFRLKEEENEESENLYNEVQVRGSGEKVDDLYLVVEGKPIYFGYNLRKDLTKGN